MRKFNKKRRDYPCALLIKICVIQVHLKLQYEIIISAVLCFDFTVLFLLSF